MPSLNAAKAATGVSRCDLRKSDRLGGAVSVQADTKTAVDFQAPRGRVLLTAIQRGVATWLVKTISPDGDVAVLPGVHPNRLQALGAAVLVARRCQGEVVP